MKMAEIEKALDSMMTFKEVCEMLDKSVRSVRHYVKNCGLPAITVGRKLYFEKQAVEKWMGSREAWPNGRFKKLAGPGGDDNVAEAEREGNFVANEIGKR